MATTTTFLRFSTSDGEVIMVDTKVAQMFTVIHEGFSSTGDLIDHYDKVIPLPIRSTILQKVIAFCEYFLEVQKKAQSGQTELEEDTYKKEHWYLAMTHHPDVLEAMLHAADYLDIPPLVQYTAGTLVGACLEKRTAHELKEALLGAISRI